MAFLEEIFFLDQPFQEFQFLSENYLNFRIFFYKK